MDSVFLDCFLRKPGRYPPDGGGSPPDPGGGGGGDDDPGDGGKKKIPDKPDEPPPRPKFPGPGPPGPPDPPDRPTTPRPRKCAGWVCDEEAGLCSLLLFTPPAKWKECWPDGITVLVRKKKTIYKDKLDCEANCGPPPDPKPRPGPTTPRNKICDGWVCNEVTGECEAKKFNPPAKWKECWPGGLTEVVIGGKTIYKTKQKCEINCGDDDQPGPPIIIDPENPPGPTTPKPKRCDGWVCDPETQICKAIIFGPPAKWKKCWPSGLTQVNIGGTTIFKNQADCLINCIKGDGTDEKPGPDDPPPGPVTPGPKTCTGWICDEQLGICISKVFTPPAAWKECWPSGVSQVTIGGQVIYKNRPDCQLNCIDDDDTGERPGPDDPKDPPPPITPPSPLTCAGWVCDIQSGNCTTKVFKPPVGWKTCWPNGITKIFKDGSFIYKNQADCIKNCMKTEDPDFKPGPDEPPPGPTTPGPFSCAGWVCNKESGLCSSKVFTPPSAWNKCWPSGISQVKLDGQIIYRNKGDCEINCNKGGSGPDVVPGDPDNPPGPTTPAPKNCPGWICNSQTGVCRNVVFGTPANWDTCWPDGLTQIVLGGTTFYKNEEDCKANCQKRDDPDDKPDPPDPPPGPRTPGPFKCDGWVCDPLVSLCFFTSFHAPASWDVCWPTGITSVLVGGKIYYKHEVDCIKECGDDDPDDPPPPGKPTSPFGDNATGDDSGAMGEYLNLTYRTDFQDPVYDRRLNFLELSQDNNTSLVSRGDLDSTLFRSKVHGSVRGVTEINKGVQKFSDLPYGDISTATIKQSLDKEFREQILSLRDLAGRSMSNRILDTIKRLIVSDSLNIFDPSIFRRLQVIQEANRKKYIKKEGFQTSLNEASAVIVALDKGKPLDPKPNYGRVQEENMRLWKTIATDVNKYLPVSFADGTEGKLFINVDDSIVLNSSGVGKAYITDGDQLETNEGYIPIKGDLDKALMLDFEDTEQVLYLLDETYSIQLDVTTPARDLIEESYDLSSNRDDFYFFKLDASTVTDIPRKNELVRQTEAKYDIDSTASGRNAWVKFKPWPYFVFYVMNDDPILDYIEAKERVTLTFKDFTLDNFVGEVLPIFPRRIPWHFIIIPTDKTELVLYHTYSKVVEYGDRRMTFTMNINPTEYKQRWDHHYLKTRYLYPRVDITSDTNTQGVAYIIQLDKVSDMDRYRKGSEILPRKERPYRKLLKLLREFRDEFVLDNITVAWFDVFSRMSPNEIKTFPSEVLNFKDFKTKALTRNLSSNDSVSRQYPKVKDIPNRGETDSIISLGYSSPVRKIPDDSDPEIVQPL